MAPQLKTGYTGFFNPDQHVAIASGDTESEVIGCLGFVLVGLILPSIFTGTSLTFLVGDSPSGFQARGEILFNTNPANGDTITINGVLITLVTGTPSGSQVQISGVNAAGTMANLQAFLDATVDPDLLACTYSSSGTLMTVVAVTAGEDGNAISFAKSSSHMTLTPSGGTLSGGGFTPLYDASNAQVSMTVAAGRAYAVDPTNFQGISYFKIKSGATELNARTVSCQLRG